jgi:hypothetical protein
MRELRDAIIGAVASARQETVVKPFAFGSGQNEMLFFFKPECFLETTTEQQQSLIDTALELFLEFGAIPAGASVLTAEELRSREIMDRHYGFINRASRNSAAALSQDEIMALRQSVGASTITPVLGGHEFLNLHREFNPSSLDHLWSTKKSRKVKSGLYFESFEVKGNPVILVNGFHPAQLEHFTAAERKVVLILLQSDLPWRFLRQFMLGDTFPERAIPGSFRRILYDDPARYGLRGVSIAANAGHLSAGPFEAMFELSNFFSSNKSISFSLEQTSMWTLLCSIGAEPAQIQRALSNPRREIGGGERSLFDLTEEIDARTAGHLFLQRFCDIQ